MMKEVIKNFPEQLEYRPEIENQAAFGGRDKFIVVGMGGSNLAAEIIKGWKPKLDVVIHKDYGLPDMEERELKERLVILSSYSGATEETISAFNEAISRGLPSVAIAARGELLELAKKNNVPYIQLPDIKTHPRFAVGLSIKAALKAMGEESILNDVGGEAASLNADNYEDAGRNLAHGIEGRIPLIYSSGRNLGLAYFWKVNFNETVKIPAFSGALPELNHNEIAGFGKFAENFACIFLADPDDEPRIQKRMDATAKILEGGGVMVLKADIAGPSPWHKSFAGILSAFWTSYFLAEHYGVDPEDVSIIEKFKSA
jgi:glucose/mannose-6-phosphate isomerase